MVPSSVNTSRTACIALAGGQLGRSWNVSERPGIIVKFDLPSWVVKQPVRNVIASVIVRPATIMEFFSVLIGRPLKGGVKF